MLGAREKSCLSIERLVSRRMSTPLRVGFVGFGYWGPNILRNLDRLPRADVVASSAPFGDVRVTYVKLSEPLAAIEVDGR